MNFWATYFSLFMFIFSDLYWIGWLLTVSISFDFCCLLRASLYSRSSIGMFLLNFLDFSVILGWKRSSDSYKLLSSLFSLSLRA